jgi:hypothetical protein
MKFIFNLIFVILVLINNHLIADRTVTTQINPSCSKCGTEMNGTYNNLFYVKAAGENDTLHVLYSNINSFTIMFFKTSPKGVLQVNQDALLSNNASQMLNSISFTEQPSSTFGYSFPIIYEFNDVNGTADMTKINGNDNFILHETSQLKWSPFKENTNQSGYFEGKLDGSNGSIRFYIRYPFKNARDSNLPHLLLNEDSSSIDLIIDSVETSFNMSKFATKIVFLSEFDNASLKNKKTLDDEYTPGTFQLWNVQITDKENQAQNYLEWKPVFYYWDPASLENSTITKEYDVKPGDMIPLGIGSAVYNSKVLVNSMNVSFGISGDKKNGYFYSQTNYSSWTFSIGLGEPQTEEMSSIVTLVIIAGFGLPGLVILIGLVFMAYKKIKGSRNSEFTPL